MILVVSLRAPFAKAQYYIQIRKKLKARCQMHRRGKSYRKFEHIEIVITIASISISSGQIARKIYLI